MNLRDFQINYARAGGVVAIWYGFDIFKDSASSIAIAAIAVMTIPIEIVTHVFLRYPSSLSAPSKDMSQ